MISLPFVLRRASRHWQILLTLGLGVVLATTLLASAPLLVDTVVELSLRLALSSSVTEGNLRLVTAAPLDQVGFQALDSEIQSLLRPALDEYLDRVVPSAQSGWMFPWVSGLLATDQRVNLRMYDGLQDRVEYVAGGWPAEASAEPGVIRAVVSEGMAHSYVLRVGDRLPLSLGQDDAVPGVWIEVAGIVRPQDPLHPYWFGEFSPLIAYSTSRWAAQYSAIVPPDAFFSAVASLFPEDDVALSWHVLLRHQAFFTADIEPLQTQLAALRTGLDAFQPRVALYTRVPDILAGFQKQLETIRVPLYILVAEVMLVALYHVTVVSALSIRQVEREFAILRSRGSSGWQIARIQLVEALLIVAAAFVSGPWLGAGLVRGLSWAGPLAGVGSADGSLRPSPSAWLAAGIGALACLAGFLLPLGPALRRSIVTHQQTVARSTRPPWWQRLYLDVFVLVGGLILLWRLRLYGEIITGGPGGVRLDWLLLLSPVALLLGTATILLRVFPLILRAVALLAARRRGLVSALALWQASRNPTYVTQLVLLLTLAVSLGNLANGLNTALDQSEYDRAYYLAGRDLRLVSQRAVPLVDLESAPGVLELAGVWRGQGTVDLEATHAYPPFEILAIEPDSFAAVTTYRADFADLKMDELLGRLAVPTGEHPALLLLPGRPAEFGLWLWGAEEDKAELDSYQRWIDGDNDAERVSVEAKLQTAQGELFTVRLRPEGSGQVALQTDSLNLHVTAGGRDIGLRIQIKPDDKGWHYFAGPLPDLPASSYPLSLHSLWFQNQATRLGVPIGKALVLVIDDLTVVDAETRQPQVVEDLDGLARPLFLNARDGLSRYGGLITEVTDKVSRSGKWGQWVTMYSSPRQTYPLRLRQIWERAPLPAIASPAFIRATELEVGDIVRARVNSMDIDFRIAGTVRHFPTMYEQLEAGYLVTSRDLLLASFNDTSQRPTNPNEVLIVTDGSTSIDSLSSMVPMLSQGWRAETVRQTLKANPLALGLRGATFFGSALTILLSLVGFATHFYLSVREREMLHGVLRAIGMAPRQLYGSIVIEQAVLILAGVALGTGLAVLLNEITMPRLPVSLGDQPPVPPFVPREDWLAVGLLYLGLALAFLVVLGLVTALLWRARIHRILRIGQE